jgi:hypothetical protein
LVRQPEHAPRCGVLTGTLEKPRAIGALALPTL